MVPEEEPAKLVRPPTARFIERILYAVFINIEDARKARKEAEIKYFGEFKGQN